MNTWWSQVFRFFLTASILLFLVNWFVKRTSGYPLQAFSLTLVAILIAFALLILARLLHYRAERRYRYLLHTDALNLPPKDFEYRVQHILKDLGWQNVRVVGGAGDKGIDIQATHQNRPYAVQCKRYKSYVAPGVVRDLAGAMQLAGVHYGLLVTTGYVSQEARRDARNMNIEIWDRNILARKTYESTSLRNNPESIADIRRKRNAWSMSALLFVMYIALVNVILVVNGFTSQVEAQQGFAGNIVILPTATKTTIAATSTPTPALSITTVVLAEGNIRAKPATTGQYLSYILPQEQVQLLARTPDAEWLYITSKRDITGWVHRSLLDLDPQIEADLMVQAE